MLNKPILVIGMQRNIFDCNLDEGDQNIENNGAVRCKVMSKTWKPQQQYKLKYIPIIILSLKRVITGCERLSLYTTELKERINILAMRFSSPTNETEFINEMRIVVWEKYIYQQLR